MAKRSVSLAGSVLQFVRLNVLTLKVPKIRMANDMRRLMKLICSVVSSAGTVKRSVRRRLYS